MKKFTTSILMTLSLSIFFFTGCANTRNPMPCQTKNNLDNDMTCKQISAEYRSNTESAAQKIAKNNSDDVQDVVVGFLIWPGLADFKNADGIEGNAMLDRNLYLMELAKIKDCDTIDFPVQPKRYD